MSQVPHTELLPPSSFQSTKPPDPWQGIAKVSEELLQLRRETHNVRQQEQNFSQASHTGLMPREQGDSCYHRHASSDEFKYANELIGRQAKEILDLKNEVLYIREAHQKEMRQIEDELVDKERQYTTKITSLETMLQRKEDNYDQEIDRLSFEHQKLTEELTERIKIMSDEFDEVKRVKREREEELSSILKSCQENSDSTLQQLQCDLREKESENKNLSQQVKQLKSYIGETEKSYRPTEVWRKENETLSNKLQILEVDRENLKSTIELLNVRLTSMGEILSVQEADISKSKVNIMDKKNLENLLLTRWREKVFALMVQNKSSEIYVKQNVESWKVKYSSLQEELQSANRQVEILKHQVAEKTALLDLEKINSKKATEELSQTQDIAITLDNQMMDNKNHLNLLQTVAQTVDKRLADTMKKISSSLSILKSHGERISFASSRVTILQGQLAKQDAMLKLEGKDRGSIKNTSDEEESKDHILVELERVTKERDFVTSQLKQVSETLNDKLQENRETYETEVQNLKITVENLEVELQNKSKAVAKLTEQLEEREIEEEEMNERIEGLSKELGRQKNVTEQAVENQKMADEEMMRKEIVEMEKQVNLARREQTKAVVSLRQIERQSLREKERLTEQLKLSENHYNKHIEVLQEQLKSTEKERNIMMATLRQEGLLSKIKQERGIPAKLDEEDTKKEDLIKSMEAHHSQSTQESSIVKQDMCDVIEDLKSLAAVVIDDKISSGSDSEDDTQS